MKQDELVARRTLKMIYIMCNVSGKGCSTVLIPARVVQALQLHFDQMAATSGPKAGAFHPLHGTQLSTTFYLYLILFYFME